jgi:two-component system cell cycle sensor histidine kinase/response regulator CckA
MTWLPTKTISWIGITILAAAGVLVWQVVTPGRLEDRVYRIGWDPDPPFQAARPDGSATGLAVELVREAASRRGIRLEWVRQGGGADGALRDRKVDLWPLLTLVPERTHHIHITEPYLETEHCFLVRAESGFSDTRDLAAALISFHDLRINRIHLNLALPGARLLPNGGTDAAIESVCRGRADAAFVDEYTAISAMLGGLTCAAQELLLIATPEIQARMGVGATFAASPAADAIRDEIGKIAGEGKLPTPLLHWSYFSRRHLESLQALREANRRQRLLTALAGVLLSALLIVGWLTHRTLSERRRARSAEQELDATQQSYRLLTEQAAEGVFLVDRNGRFLLVNICLCEMLGYTREEMLQLTVLDTCLTEEREVASSWLERTAFGATVRFERHMRRKNGTAIPIEASVVRLWDGNSQGIIRDITERKRAEAALRESEERFRNVADSAPVMIWVAGTDKVLNFFNKTWLDFVGRTMEQELDNGWTEGVHPDDLDHCFASYSSAFENRETFHVEARLRRADGEYRWVLCTGVPRFASDGVFEGYIGSDIDITDLKRAQQETLARHKLESMGLLAGGIAHDFNNLLGSILTTTELILSELPAGSPGFEGVQAIHSVADRGAGIVRQMMSYAGQENPAFERVELGQLVNEMIQLLKVSISKRAILRADIPETLPAVWANAAQIRQVVMNLVINASEALGGKEGVISVTLRRVSSGPDRDHIRLEVSDTGCGMTEETRNKMFDPFFTTKFPGRGLGLAAVQGIVRSHRAVLDVATAPGKGCSIQIQVPCASEPEQASHQASQSIGDGATLNGTILVVEDEDTLRYAVSRMLRKRNLNVIEARDGKSALEVFRINASAIDVALLDMTLPGMPGQEVLGEFRRIRPDLKVIIASAYGKDQALSVLGELQPWLYIRKPYQFSELMELLRRVFIEPEGMAAIG